MTTVFFKREQKTDKDNKEQYSYVSKFRLRGQKGRLSTELRLFNYFEDEYGNLEIVVCHIPLKELLEDITRHEADSAHYVKERDYYKNYFNVSREGLEGFKAAISGKLTVNQCFGTSFTDNDEIVVDISQVFGHNLRDNLIG